MTASVGKISDFLLELYRDARRQRPDVFQKNTLAHLREFVTFDFGGWGGGTRDSREVSEVIMLDQSQGLFRDWSAVAEIDGYCDLALRRLNHTVLFDDIPDFRESTAYNEHWRRFDARNMVATIMAEPIDGYVSFVGLCSADTTCRYGESQRALKQMLMPHVSNALHSSRENQVLEAETTDEGVGLITSAGVILASRMPFAHLLRDEWARPDPRTLAAILPTGPAGSVWRGRSIQLRIEPIGPYFLLRARPRNDLDMLPPREQQVAEHFGRGMTHKEVARTLSIAPSTVRNHLAQIYEKLGIRDKGELARLVGTVDGLRRKPHQRSQYKPTT